LNAIALDEASAGSIVRNRLAARVLEAVEGTLAAIGEGRAHELLDAWRCACPYLGRQVRIDAAGFSVEGTALDVDDQGVLLIGRADGGTERVVAGTLRCIDAEEDPTST
jgi:biotin-(acetyl-CoA carboxylase) ligase